MWVLVDVVVKVCCVVVVVNGNKNKKNRKYKFDPRIRIQSTQLIHKKICPYVCLLVIISHTAMFHANETENTGSSREVTSFKHVANRAEI